MVSFRDQKKPRPDRRNFVKGTSLRSLLFAYKLLLVLGSAMNIVLNQFLSINEK